MNRLLALLLGILLLAACQNDHTVRAEIQKSLDQCVLAVNTKDIDLYMQGIPDDFEIQDENGQLITKEMQREYALRDWAIIDTTLSNNYTIDSLQVFGDSALVNTYQAWKRIMYRRDGITTDTVLTTQRHSEIWRKKKGQWVNYDITELGGSIFINGEEYIP